MQEVTGSIPVISTRKKSTAQKCAVFFCAPSVLPLLPVKNAFGALRRVRQTQNYKEPFRGIWSERSGDYFKSSRSQGTGCKAFAALQPLNSCWTFAQSYGIILSAIAGIVHRLVYQPSKLRRWVRFPLPAPQDLNLERFGSFLFIRAAILQTGGGNATIEP